MLTIINDTHIGAIRSAGTTANSQLKLREHILTKFEALLPSSGDLMILGDLFDTFAVPVSDFFKTYTLLLAWLSKPTAGKLYLVAGNHDLSKTSNQMGSFDLLGNLLQVTKQEVVSVIKGVGCMTPYGYVIPHMPNQDLFDLELAKVPACDFLFVHCNYDNYFAAQSDQSLNLSRAQAEACPAKSIVFAHEHHARVSGKALVIGNQIASSVSDWLPNVDKRCAHIRDSRISYTVCGSRAEEFCNVSWDADATAELQHLFIRVVGTVSADVAPAVLTKLATLRKQSPALVITNAVVIESSGEEAVLAESLETVQGFDIWQALRTVLSAEEVAILESVC